jgi:hypothetical protein
MGIVERKKRNGGRNGLLERERVEMGSEKQESRCRVANKG